MRRSPASLSATNHASSTIRGRRIERRNSSGDSSRYSGHGVATMATPAPRGAPPGEGNGGAREGLAWGAAKPDGNAEIFGERGDHRIVGTPLDAPSLEPRAQLDGGRSPERAGTRFVGESEDRRHRRRDVDEQLPHLVAHPARVLLVAGEHPIDERRGEGASPAESRQEPDVPRKRAAGEGRRGAGVAPGPQAPVTLEAALDLLRVSAHTLAEPSDLVDERYRG